MFRFDQAIAVFLKSNTTLVDLDVRGNFVGIGEGLGRGEDRPDPVKRPARSGPSNRSPCCCAWNWQPQMSLKMSKTGRTELRSFSFFYSVQKVQRLYVVVAVIPGTTMKQRQLSTRGWFFPDMVRASLIIFDPEPSKF